MEMTAALVALAASIFLLAWAIAILVLLRRGDGPLYSASRAYDANRREALALLLGEEVAAVTREQWFAPARREAVRGDPLAAPFRESVAEALLCVVPADRRIEFEPDGRARIADAVVVPAISTADLRAYGELEAWSGRGLLIALVLVNPEPPGGDARRVALPVQVLFPALERAGRGDLVRRFARMREMADPTSATTALEAR